MMKLMIIDTQQVLLDALCGRSIKNEDVTYQGTSKILKGEFG